MKRFLMEAIAYLTTGMGSYYTLFGDTNIYGFTILFLGLLGVLFAVFYEKLHTV